MDNYLYTIFLSLLPHDKMAEICSIQDNGHTRHGDTWQVQILVQAAASATNFGDRFSLHLHNHLLFLQGQQPFLVARSAEAPESTVMQKHFKEPLGLYIYIYIYIESLAYISTSSIFFKVILLQCCHCPFLPPNFAISYTKLLKEES